MLLVLAGAPPNMCIFLNIEVAADLPTLFETRFFIQANSGSGKTWAIRRFLEQSHGSVQHIVITMESSLHTLRERMARLHLEGGSSHSYHHPWHAVS